jgi:hypothetical protein
VAINGSRTDLSKARSAFGIIGAGDNLTAMNALVRLEASNDAAAIDLVLRSAFPSDQERDSSSACANINDCSYLW